ncbi:hypothetical protein F511_13711 [Dorcoceras hygrometricum]|uniref:Mitochondrial transcription termination factor family protein n=1 Tax=Dorcoceras hygrometricum TaxID=472368 RepID=A0A2Z7BAH1_9LAMI|nr:hypothetical protein F511_13711 [Dorcoceras hygrometricum]
MSVICRSRIYLLSRGYASASSHLHFFSTSWEAPTSKSLSVSDYLIQRHQFSQQTATRIASFATRLSNPEKADSVISILIESGFSTPQLERVLRSRPLLLAASTEKIIKPKIKIFQDLGLSKGEIAKIISKDPGILDYSAKNRVLPSLAVLKSLLGSDAEVAKLLKVSGLFLIMDLEKTLVPNVKFLESCGIPKKQIVNHIYFFPRVLLHKPEVLRRCVDKVDEMGVSRKSKGFIYAVRIVRSFSNVNWDLKLKAFRDSGFSETDILKMFRTSSPVFCTSKEKTKMVKELLLASGKYDLSSIVNYPISLMYSVEKRYKPRLHVLRILETEKLIDDWPSLRMLCMMSNAQFFERYVAPYSNKLGKDVKFDW